MKLHEALLTCPKISGEYRVAVTFPERSHMAVLRVEKLTIIALAPEVTKCDERAPGGGERPEEIGRMFDWRPAFWPSPEQEETVTEVWIKKPEAEALVFVGRNAVGKLAMLRAGHPIEVSPGTFIEKKPRGASFGYQRRTVEQKDRQPALAVARR